MDYPTMAEVEQANREQIYRWFLTLSFPRLVKQGKGKSSYWTWSPNEQARIIVARVYKRWLELGGHNREIANKILEEEDIKKANGRPASKAV
jgi:hypothetical protein